MTILLLGGHGQVGHALRATLPPLGPLVVTTRHGGDGDLGCDLTDRQSVAALLDEVSPTLIVNAAAYTAVDKAESEPAAAAALNSALPGQLGAWAAVAGARVVHYSTDYVFDGESTRPYREDDLTGPASVYGQTKLDGERALAASGASHITLRTAWVYAADGHNFMRTMMRLAHERDTLSVVDDQWGTPTSAPWIAMATAAILAQVPREAPGGTFHLTAAGETTWRGFAEAIFSGAVARGLLERAPRVQSITTAEYPTPAKRPARSVLDGSRLEASYGLIRPDWTTLLGDVLDTMTLPN